MKLYTEGYELNTDEYLLKIDDRRHRKIPTGFLSKFTQKGAIPEAFKKWGKNYNESESSLKVYVFTETYNTKCGGFFFLFFLHGFSIGNGQQGISYNVSGLVAVGD